MNRNRELISYPRSKAKETLQNAQLLFEAKRFPSSVNRLYYALFYEVMALLLTKDLSSAKHGGVMSFFNEHFVKKKIVTVDSGRYFSRMSEFRQKSDYSDFVTFEEAKVREWIGQGRTRLTGRPSLCQPPCAAWKTRPRSILLKTLKRNSNDTGQTLNVIMAAH